MSKLKVLDLFSGIGGFSLGLDRTGGFETAAFCEFDQKARLVLQKHWPDVPIFDDVRKLTKEKLDEQGISVDVICGGFPCQDISLAGKGAGLAGERSGLWFEFHRLIKEIRPSWVIAENVSALRSRGLDQVLRSLAEIGYDAEWHCIPASAVGAPHQRDRIWIVAYSNRDRKWPWIRSEQSTRDTARKCVSDSSELERIGLVADTESVRIQGLRPSGEQEPYAYVKSELLMRYGERSRSTYWAVEPALGRVANGVPKRMDRLKQLGNAVVPQIPEIIGYAILENIKNGTP